MMQQANDYFRLPVCSGQLDSEAASVTPKQTPERRAQAKLASPPVQHLSKICAGLTAGQNSAALTDSLIDRD